MGYDASRIKGDVDEELICPICSGVLEEPLQAPVCEHTFCSKCIQEWLSHGANCPVDRTKLSSLHLKPVPRLLRNLLSRLFINCDNAAHGCEVVVKLDVLKEHLGVCEYNPKKPVSCDQGCGSVIPKDELKGHNCVKTLCASIQIQERKLQECQQEIQEQKVQLNEQKRELQLFKEFIRAMGCYNPLMRTLHEEIEKADILRWTKSLPKAKVTRWGGMISTPDVILQNMIKRSLVECGCPSYILDELILNAHERRWPPGLSTLETRQMNRRQYENYICRRVPGKQAVLVMACDNSHMNEDMSLEPGLVMIFAHGIE